MMKGQMGRPFECGSGEFNRAGRQMAAAARFNRGRQDGHFCAEIHEGER